MTWITCPVCHQIPCYCFQQRQMNELPYPFMPYAPGVERNATGPALTEPVAQGWQCPVCKRVMAPSAEHCSKCP